MGAKNDPLIPILPDNINAVENSGVGSQLDAISHAIALSGAAAAAAGATGAACERFVRGARRRAREAGRDMSFPT